MKTFKIMTVVGTRPEIIRLSCVLQKLDACDAVDHLLVHTGQNYDYELNEVFFKDLGLRTPDHFLNAAAGTPAATIGKVISAVDEVLARTQPDAFLVLGDTNSCLAAIPAKRRKVPVFHMEAGNRCFDQRVPEEINRRIVDHVADINLTYSDIAREYLLREGLPPDRVIKTGSPMYEVLETHRVAIEQSDVLQRLNVRADEFFVVSAHREENISSTMFFSFIDLLNHLVSEFDLPILLSAHPRTRARLEKERIELPDAVRVLKPLGFIDYIALQTAARATLSDSGTISEESSILNFPAINIRETHERPEAFEEASVMFTGMKVERVMQALRLLADQPRGAQRLLRPVADYTIPNVADKVVRIILSYTDYVNRTVWAR